MGRRQNKRLEAYTATMEIIDASTDGRGVARHEGQVIFVEGGVPGDQAQVWVYRKQKDVLIGKIEKLIVPSPHRKAAECQHFEDCGGCKWQHMQYAAQLAHKEKQVHDAFERIAKVSVAETLPIMGNASPYYYRNKLEFSFSDKAWLNKAQMEAEPKPDAIQGVLGYHVPRIYDKVLDIEDCRLQKPMINEIRNAVRDYGRAEGYTFHNMRTHQGFLRNICFRTSEHTGEIMVILIVFKDEWEKVAAIFQHLEAQFPQISSYIWMVNEKLNDSFNDLPFRVWKGSPYITERLDKFDFRISPVSFFQTNPRQAQALYAVVKDFLTATLPAGQSRHPVIYDLYSGTGSIGIYVSDLAEKVVGIEYVKAATQDAQKNVALNDLQQFRFYAGDMKKILTDELVSREGAPQVIITDPPRQGMEAKVVQQILKLQPEYVIYVSCKPATQARDLALMQTNYEVLKIQPVDMFPQTAHVENVALLRRKVAQVE